MKVSKRYAVAVNLVFGAIAVLALSRCGSDAGKSQNPVAIGDPEKAKFSWLSENVLAPSCVKCHGDAKTLGGVHVASYERAVTGDLVIPGNPEGSSLYIQVATAKMPRKAEKLSDEKIQAIYDWIKIGAPNN